ncbi:hypothetical protein RHS04_00055 [Rhizoctonia solani]|uniref:Uncharacterized protein n=1 Tax=Rhizoctonia solani TaxID=456999 RepID=A0A8H7LLN3_9AGAM|nr:hypothetical protein RHS04_00055 [Rhizoctonia solani]
MSTFVQLLAIIVHEGQDELVSPFPQVRSRKPPVPVNDRFVDHVDFLTDVKFESEAALFYGRPFGSPDAFHRALVVFSRVVSKNGQDPSAGQFCTWQTPAVRTPIQENALAESSSRVDSA